MPSNPVIRQGSIHRLGSTVVDGGVNFALYSAHAEKVELCLFSSDGKMETSRLMLPDVTNQIWNGFVEGLQPGTLYGYRVYGPYQPDLGHRFNHHKLLLDPYARKLHGDFVWSDLHYGFCFDVPDDDLTFDTRDSASVMPKCVVVEDAPALLPQRNRVVKRNTIVYEAHVKGLSMAHPAVPLSQRGTFKGVSHQALVDHLTSLGITTLELLPVQSFLNEHFLVERKLTNYWGYNTLSFFAPHQAYLETGDIAEFREMVAALHDAGIEVILDVVYNHTAEGGRQGPTLSFRGIDNLSYYRLQAENKRFYINDSGCGNTLNFSNPFVIMMVMDSLRYWVTQMGVDGFRFDLATVLAREHYGYDKGSGFLDALHQDPTLSAVKFIAEPWDIGPGGYQLGNFPPGWSEWNDRYRDTVRRFWRGDSGVLPDFARRLHGSSDIFEHSGRKPSASINFITSHDGFTLSDLVSYCDKHNEQNQEDNRDGHSENFSENYGVEGESLIFEVNEVRSRQRKNFLTTLFVSQGIPMLCGGDEYGKTQHGNNNAYCQDNSLSWQDWERGEGEHASLLEFSRYLISIRKNYPEFWQDSYVHASSDPASKAIYWYNTAGEVMQSVNWGQHNAKSVGYMIVGTSAKGVRRLLTLFNAGSYPLRFRLPPSGSPDGWQVILDTSIPDGQPAAPTVLADQFSMLAHTTVILLSSPTPNITGMQETLI